MHSSPSLDAGGRDASASRSALRTLWPLAVLQLLLWGGAALFFYRSVQLDSAEQFVWAVSLENGYWKHPPLPSWMMHALVQLFGPSVALPVVATQCAMLCALLILYQLGAKMMSPQRAMLGVLLTSLISYFNLSADSFNHTTVLAPFIAACLLSFHSALRRGGWHRWALAGLCAGLAMLVKYLALLHLVAIGIYVLVDRTHHRRQVAWGFLFASTTALVVLLPHFLWLGTHDFLPLRYAREVTQASSRGSDLLFSVCAFLAIQGLRLAPMLLVAWLLMRSGDGRASQTGSGAAPARGDRMFLWVAGTGPLVMEILIALATGAELQTRWGGTAFLAAGLLMASYLPARIETNTIRRSLWTASAVQLVLCVASTVSQTVVAPQIKRASRLSFPGDVLAREAMKTWSLHTHAPLRLVVSDIWLGGNLIAHTGERNLAVLVDGRRFKSPWVRQDALSACGALVLDQLSDGHGATEEPDPALQAMFKQAVDTGIWELPWDSPAAPGSSPRGMVRWGVILPAHDQGCLNASK